MTALAAALWLLCLPAQADYPQAAGRFNALSRPQQARVVLGLIASGDIESLELGGFSPRLYRAIRAFERREGFDPDGVLDDEQLQGLGAIARDFRDELGIRPYDHPDSGATLRVPRSLFDDERDTAEGLLFSRRDGGLSLAFVSFPVAQKSYEALWRTLSAPSGDKHVIYARRFASRFVVTGSFHQSKFYTMMARTGSSTTGFTFSWGAPYEELGRKVSTFLANDWAGETR